MSSIIFDSASVEYPLFGIKNRSLKSELFKKVGGLFKSNKNITHVTALNNINISINTGDRVGLVGHNGSGKSTFLKLASGSLFPTSGRVDIDGKVSSLLDLSMGLDGELTGIENIKLKSTIHKVLNYEEYKKNVIDFAQLGDFINLPVRSYSNGMVLRLAFAASAYIKPDILLLDEIISVGDEDFSKKSENHMKNIISNSNILILANHNFEIIKKYCNKILFFDKGSIVKIENF